MKYKVGDEVMTDLPTHIDWGQQEEYNGQLGQIAEIIGEDWYKLDVDTLQYGWHEVFLVDLRPVARHRTTEDIKKLLECIYQGIRVGILSKNGVRRTI